MTRLGELRREIARIHTLLREREIAAFEAQEGAGGADGDDRQMKGAAEPEATERPNRRKIREGTVSSASMDKTVVVDVIERVRHRRYDKTVQRTKHLYAHDEANDVNVGDRVRVQETRPLSKLKRWRVVEVLERAK